MSDQTEKLMKDARDNGHKITKAIEAHVESIKKYALSKDEKAPMVAIVTLGLFLLEVKSAIEKAHWTMETAYDQIKTDAKV